MVVVLVMVNFLWILVWWCEVDWWVCVVYLVMGILVVVLGVCILLVLFLYVVDFVIGFFLIVMVLVWYWLVWYDFKVNFWYLVIGGVVIGYFIGIVVLIGLFSVLFFLFYGLLKGVFLVMEVVSLFGFYFVKLVMFECFGVLIGEVFIKGLIVGVLLMLGVFIVKCFVLYLKLDMFCFLMDGIMIVVGFLMLWNVMWF